ncbi:MAG: GIY-YIG nuclease family protein [Patescibacteria group bacterium]|nr:GIY-YIG nuclease family protein [Patescibacteria group bacterium]
MIWVRQVQYWEIGYSSDPADRREQIETSSPFDCELLFAIAGGVDLERRLHREFAACHHRREWFFYCGRLKTFIEEFKQAPSPKVPQDFPLEEFGEP